ncbi:MAG: D-alanyl-D-alanine carboxypeptidase [Blastocatellia bacterium]|nr:D-alanyl-D-alanine carboxypeptidase [Blastocatellia bacterium]
MPTARALTTRRFSIFSLLVLLLFTQIVWAQQPGGPVGGDTRTAPAPNDAQLGIMPPPLTMLDVVEGRLAAYTKSDLPHGIYFEDLKGKSVLDINADQYFNPASVTKVMTSLAVLERYGTQYRYTTRVWYTGEFDKERRAITGDLIVEGDADPSFVNESAFSIGEKLREAGIEKVEGNLLVGNGLSLNLRRAALPAGAQFLALVDRARWNRVSENAWNFFEQVRTYGTALKSIPIQYEGVGFPNAKVLPDDGRQPRKMLLEYRSAPLVKIVKVMNAFSNNDMAHWLGGMVGGAYGVREYVISKIKLAPEEIRLETTSGLGNNAVTARAMVKILRYALGWCEKNKVALTDLLPIGGVDVGTLAGRFKQPELVGSVVAKTGTLNRVSALAGVLYTRSRGPVLFAILERGLPNSLRVLQEEIIGIVATECGGTQAVAFGTEMGPSLIEDAQIRVAVDRTHN